MGGRVSESVGGSGGSGGSGGDGGNGVHTEARRITEAHGGFTQRGTEGLGHAGSRRRRGGLAGGQNHSDGDAGSFGRLFNSLVMPSVILGTLKFRSRPAGQPVR